jgi:hypothetical protein
MFPFSCVFLIKNVSYFLDSPRMFNNIFSQKIEPYMEYRGEILQSRTGYG